MRLDIEKKNTKGPWHINDYIVFVQLMRVYT